MDRRRARPERRHDLRRRAEAAWAPGSIIPRTRRRRAGRRSPGARDGDSGRRNVDTGDGVRCLWTAFHTSETARITTESPTQISHWSKDRATVSKKVCSGPSTVDMTRVRTDATDARFSVWSSKIISGHQHPLQQRLVGSSERGGRMGLMSQRRAPQGPRTGELARRAV